PPTESPASTSSGRRGQRAALQAPFRPSTPAAWRPPRSTSPRSTRPAMASRGKTTPPACRSRVRKARSAFRLSSNDDVHKLSARHDVLHHLLPADESLDLLIRKGQFAQLLLARPRGYDELAAQLTVDLHRHLDLVGLHQLRVELRPRLVGQRLLVPEHRPEF